MHAGGPFSCHDRRMGARNYLVEGGSGVGKTSVAEELERRGYHVVHGDRVLAYHGDPQTGEPIDKNPFETEAENIRWRYDRWIWPVERVRALIADQTHPVTFFCGHSANSDQFIDLFDAVFVLRVDVATLDGRLAGRLDDEFGGKPIERDFVVHLHETGYALPTDAVTIDSTPPVAQVVDTILSHCEE